MDVIVNSLGASWLVLTEMAPYLLLGFAVAGALSVLISPEWVERHLGGNRVGQVFAASLFGVPLPLCSCGVLPVAASLRRHGAGKGATTAFLLSTPQTGVDSIAVTYALLGPFLAVFRPIAALLTGIVGGVLVQTFDDRQEEAAPEHETTAGSCCATSTDQCEEQGTCCEAHQPSSQSRLVRALRFSFLTLPRDIGKALVVGILLSGVIAALIGPNTLESALGGGLLPLLAAMVIGVPLYVCATASTPIALGLIYAGLSPGAALVFLITGPATNSAAVTTLWKVLGSRATVIYLLTVAISALGAGVVVDGMIDHGVVAASAVVSPDTSELAQIGHQHQDHTGVGSWFERLCAMVLVGVLGISLWPRRTGGEKGSSTPVEKEEPGTEQVSLRIEGMSCEGCVSRVDAALTQVNGVTRAEIDLASGRALIIGKQLDQQRLCETVSALGYSVTPDQA